METIAHPHRPLRADALANRERILGAARELFASRGADTEMRDIAERAGVGVGTLYRHFASRDDLLAALLDQTSTATVAQVREAAAAPDPRDAVRAVAAAMTAAHVMFGSLFEAMHGGGAAGGACEGGGPPQGFAQLGEITAGVVERGIAAGVFRADADIPTAVVVLTTCTGGPPGQRVTASPDALADFVLAALAPRP